MKPGLRKMAGVLGRGQLLPAAPRAYRRTSGKTLLGLREAVHFPAATLTPAVNGVHHLRVGVDGVVTLAREALLVREPVAAEGVQS